MSYSEGYTKTVSHRDPSESRACTLLAFVPFVNIGLAIGKMLGGSVTNGFHERRRFMKEWEKDEDYLFYEFLKNSYDGERTFTTKKETAIPCCPESGCDANLFTPSKTTIIRTAIYDIHSKEASIETLENKYGFSTKQDFASIFDTSKLGTMSGIRDLNILPNFTTRYTSDFLTKKKESNIKDILKYYEEGGD